MRIILEFCSEKTIILPIAYNEILQGLIYHSISDENKRRFLHDIGYQYNYRTYKMFTFSRLFGPYKIDQVKKSIRFNRRCSVKIAAFSEDIIEELFNTFSSQNYFQLGNNKVFVSDIYIESDDQCVGGRFATIAPLTTYQTVTLNQKKKTVFLSPAHPQFTRKLVDNLENKFYAVYSPKTSKKFDLKIKEVKTLNSMVTYYKKFVIKAYDVSMQIDGNHDSLKVALCAGLGGKNAMGYGMIERIKEDEQ